MKSLRFVSGNKFKIQEASEILGIPVIPIEEKIEELQTKDTEKLVRDKLIKAFKLIGQPLFVEHTGLYLNQLNGFPGGLTQIFWDTLEADRFAKVFGNSEDVKAVAMTKIGFCDGKKIYFFDGTIDGIISPEPRGNRDFQWDCVFIPDGFKETFSEMGKKKNEISMRKIALNKFAEFLIKNGLTER